MAMAVTVNQLLTVLRLKCAVCFAKKNLNCEEIHLEEMEGDDVQVKDKAMS